MERQQQEYNGQRISAQAFAAKYKSKKEVYNFLTVDGKVYLPPYENISIYHMKDIVSGAKKVSKLAKANFNFPKQTSFIDYSSSSAITSSSCMCPSTRH